MIASLLTLSSRLAASRGRERPLALVIAGLLVGILAAMPAAAQAPVQLATWDVQVWPEYDTPQVLVISSGRFAAETSLPQQVRVPLPAAATVHAVAYPDDTGNLLSLEWTVETGPEGEVVVFDLPAPAFVVETYADILTPPPDRRFDLEVTAPYAAQQATLVLRQPARASDLQTAPSMTAGAADSLGNPTYSLALGPVDAGQRIPLQVAYTKADAAPSLDVAPEGAATDVGASETEWLPLVLGIVAGALLAAGGIYLLMRRSAAQPSRQARRREARRRGSLPQRQPSDGQAKAGALGQFCVRCGQKFEHNDRFCRSCGAPRR